MQESLEHRSLGQKIGEGEFADVYAWAPGQVVKLFKAGRSQRLVLHEGRMTRAAHAAGAPAPDALGEVTVDGRFGIVLTRLDGPTLLQLRQARAMTIQQVGAALATVALAVHKTPPPAKVLFLRDFVDHSLRGAGDRVPGHIATGTLSLIERLPPEDGLCHGDIHPGNVIMTADGPRLVDWTGALRAPAAFDFAVSHFVLTEVAPERVDDPQRPVAINAAMQSEYARLAGTTPEALKPALERYLPVVYVLVLLGNVFPTWRARLIRRAEAALQSKDA